MPGGRPSKKSLPVAPSVIVKKEPKFIVFGKPDIGHAEIDAVDNVLRSGWLSTGPVVKTFEEEFAAYMGGGNAVAVSSATMGLMLSLAVSCIGDSLEVITTPLTFPATINAILAMRAKPVFVDVDEHGNLDANKIKPLLTNREHRIRGILPIHYGGAAAEMREIMHLAQLYDLKVIEDAAHAFGSEFVGPAEGDKPGSRRKIGTIGDFSVFSFYPTKNITAGEGGMVMAKHADMAERIRTLSMQGLSSGAWKRYGSGPITQYEVLFPGYKGNMSDIHAAIGLTQLRRWPELLAKRTKVWNIYEDAFGWREPGHSKSLFMIRVKERDAFRQRMQEAGIGTGVHYNPIHLEPGFRFLGKKLGDFPMAEKIGLSTVSLPVSSVMNEEDAHRVVTEAKKWMGDEKNV
jgi:dTDP-4-amino-4,6-dideoxygalactose transaminase